MSDPIKWAIKVAIASACVAMFLGVLTYSGYSDGVISAVNDINDFVNSDLVLYLARGRTLLNNFVNPICLTLAIWFAFFGPAMRFAIFAVRATVDAIFKD